MSEPRTYRGKSLAEVLPQIQEELGENAVALEVRHGRQGGVGGFFAQRCVEVDAIPAESDGADFERVLAEAQRLGARGSDPQAGPPAPAGDAPGELAAPKGGAALAAMFRPDGAASPAPPQPTAVAPSTPAPAAPREPAWPEAAVDVHRSLTAKGMDAELVAEIVGEAVDHLLPFSSAGALRPLVAGQLARCLPPLPRRRPGRLAIGFVGAGGSGKSRCAARLALAYANRGARPVACLTLRAKDRGAQLVSDVSEAGVPVHVAEDAADARAYLDRVGQSAIVVVDTPGVSPRAEAELRQLADELRRLQLDECHLTLPATLSARAADELVRGTRPLGVDALTITHVDETEHLGTAIGTAIDAQLPISFIGRGPDARTGLRPALVEALALELVG